ncbi:hypothetical protein PSCICF_21040 [Pseudomonas cichorii]|nr:hypothetical protein PSCICF_21040 [Pseudomonas cichorii]GFM60170.1 hypothetical protein PSCICG_13300 [Pseudomonas cichorii]
MIAYSQYWRADFSHKTHACLPAGESGWGSLNKECRADAIEAGQPRCVHLPGNWHFLFYPRQMITRDSDCAVAWGTSYQLVMETDWQHRMYRAWSVLNAENRANAAALDY